MTYMKHDIKINPHGTENKVHEDACD